MMKLPCLDCGKIHGQTEECLNKENRFIMTEINKRPLIGLGVIIVNPADKILLGLRKGSHGAGEWSLPGGHLEWNESFEECSRREVLEETGIVLQPKYVVEQVSFTNDIFLKEDKHYITLFFKVKLDCYPVAELKEPDKCDEWQWFSPDNLPFPLFLPLNNLLKSRKEII